MLTFIFSMLTVERSTLYLVHCIAGDCGLPMMSQRISTLSPTCAWMVLTASDWSSDTMLTPARNHRRLMKVSWRTRLIDGDCFLIELAMQIPANQISASLQSNIRRRNRIVSATEYMVAILLQFVTKLWMLLEWPPVTASMLSKCNLHRIWTCYVFTTGTNIQVSI